MTSFRLALACIFAVGVIVPPQAWIRVNQLGYRPKAMKVAVWVSKSADTLNAFDIVDAATGVVRFHGDAGKPFGAYGPFARAYRLNFTALKDPGRYYVRAGSTISPVFRISENVYAGAADFALRYMRQQRSGFNPFLDDSCHTRDGYTVYGPMPDGTHLNVWGGWHDATDYLQYVTTSANATYHLLAAYRDFPGEFLDTHEANGLDGSNGMADVLDEAKWGLDWLEKMHPHPDWMFHQLADDRDHQGFRLPDRDSVDYGWGKGNGRPVYFATGKPQGLGSYTNRSTGVASIAGKFASAFALGGQEFSGDSALALDYRDKALSAYRLGLEKPGVCQTAPNREPYFYEEQNWTDDMELGAAALYELTGQRKFRREGLRYSRMEKVTPWMGADTARHYQWYPFHNFGHYELARPKAGRMASTLAGYYRDGIQRVWAKARNNGFFRGIPFIWCSNNLTASFAIQCFLYRQMTGDTTYEELEQACVDWLFGCNPWGTSMIYGLPFGGVTPEHPHSSLSHLCGYPLYGALVDGPVYGSIFKRLRGLHLYLDDPYAPFQSDLAVYHDDWGDYSTDEPTMDGTASLVYLLAAEASGDRQPAKVDGGAIVRGPASSKALALVFTGDEFAEEGDSIAAILERHHVQGSFFLTGRFFRNAANDSLIRRLHRDGNYLGPHSNGHLLYCDWTKRDSLLVTRDSFQVDLEANYRAIAAFGIRREDARYFLPPYEWYDDSIARWTAAEGLQLVDYTPGTRSNADYTTVDIGSRYVTSDSIFRSIVDYADPDGLNGFILLLHVGAGPGRADKFCNRLDELLGRLDEEGYALLRIDELLRSASVAVIAPLPVPSPRPGR